jgi:hypothetical protein
MATHQKTTTAQKKQQIEAEMMDRTSSHAAAVAEGDFVTAYLHTLTAAYNHNHQHDRGCQPGKDGTMNHPAEPKLALGQHVTAFIRYGKALSAHAAVLRGRYSGDTLEISRSLKLFGVASNFTFIYLFVWVVLCYYDGLVLAGASKRKEAFASWQSCVFDHFDGQDPLSYVPWCGSHPSHRIPFTTSMLAFAVTSGIGAFVGCAYALTYWPLLLRSWRQFAYRGSPSFSSGSFHSSMNMRGRRTRFVGGAVRSDNCAAAAVALDVNSMPASMNLSMVPNIIARHHMLPAIVSSPRFRVWDPASRRRAAAVLPEPQQ